MLHLGAKGKCKNLITYINVIKKLLPVLFLVRYLIKQLKKKENAENGESNQV